MKKGLILMLAALMLAASLTACAATQPYYDGYSNVSTTRNGYVNGTNGYGGVYNGTNYNPGYNGTGYSQSGTATGRTVTGSTSGTAMRRAGRDDAAEKQRRIPLDETGRQGHSKRSRKGCRRDFLGHVSRKGFPETGSLFLVFGMIDQNAFTAAFSAASALRYQLR